MKYFTKRSNKVHTSTSVFIFIPWTFRVSFITFCRYSGFYEWRVSTTRPSLCSAQSKRFVFNRPGITNNTAGNLGRGPSAGWRAWWKHVRYYSCKVYTTTPVCDGVRWWGGGQSLTTSGAGGMPMSVTWCHRGIYQGHAPLPPQTVWTSTPCVAYGLPIVLKLYYWICFSLLLWVFVFLRPEFGSVNRFQLWGESKFFALKLFE